MARQARQESASGYYHVMMRGINREFVFQKDSYKSAFMELLREQLACGHIALVAWCVMDNHVHMLVKAEKEALSKAIKTVSVKFAAMYNREQKRIGPVFGGRFRSENIEDDSYLLGALRYVHSNPVKARRASDASEYRWSSYGEYLGVPRYVTARERNFVWSLFDGDEKSFLAYHAEYDDLDYLDTKEEREKSREDRAFRLIEAFCRAQGIAYANEIHQHRELFAVLCRSLVVDAGLTLRKVAEYLSTTHQRVYEAVKD